MEEFVKQIKQETMKYNTFREHVIKECIITRQTFYTWEHGYPITPKYKPIINRIAEEVYGRKVFDEE